MKQRKLSEVVENYNLPVNVNFDKSNRWKFRIGKTRTYSNKTFGTMQVVGYYTERYLKGNVIRNGEWYLPFPKRFLHLKQLNLILICLLILFLKI